MHKTGKQPGPHDSVSSKLVKYYQNINYYDFVIFQANVFVGLNAIFGLSHKLGNGT